MVWSHAQQPQPHEERRPLLRNGRRRAAADTRCSQKHRYSFGSERLCHRRSHARFRRAAPLARDCPFSSKQELVRLRAGSSGAGNARPSRSRSRRAACIPRSGACASRCGTGERWVHPIASRSDIFFAGLRPCRRAPSRGRARTPLPRGGGVIDRADRRPPRPLAGDDQGLLLRPHRREGAGGEGALRRRVPRLRRLHPAAQWQGRRVRALQGLPSRRGRAPLESRARSRGDARLAGPLRGAAVFL
jgi:hypothetical protein